MLSPSLIPGRLEAGCDEAGRGPLAGPVVAAAVVLPEGYSNPTLNDSKKLSERLRNTLRQEIMSTATAWAIAEVSAQEVDRLNILRASTHAMCLAARALLGESTEGIAAAGGTGLGHVHPEALLIDGNRFYNETPLPYQCIVHGDALLMPIAAASILAKTHRDAIMAALALSYPEYGWDSNKGYPTAAHYAAIARCGITPHHRRSFNLYRQPSLFE